MARRRFRGGLPPEWGEPLYFPQLEELNLATNELNGTLPNQEWAAEGAWLSLRTLNLARNAFYGARWARASGAPGGTLQFFILRPSCLLCVQPVRAAQQSARPPVASRRVLRPPTGGLPAGWAGGAKVFADLRRLDLGENRLGYGDEGHAGQVAEQADWCPEGEAAEGGGWCAPGAAGAFARLEHLDLSQNGLRGECFALAGHRNVGGLEGWGDLEVRAGACCCGMG